jgi:hypothetical protein
LPRNRGSAQYIRLDMTEESGATVADAGARPPATVSGGRRATRTMSRLAPAAVFGVCIPPLLGLWRSQGAPMEEGFMLTFPELVLHGDVPNRDFLHLYGPGSLWVLAAVFAVFGVRLASERAVGFLQQLGVALGVYSLLRPWGPWVAASGGAITAVIILTPSGLSAMAWIGGVALGLWALRAALEKRLVLAGLLGGAALLYRLDLVLAVGLSLGAVFLALDQRGRRTLATAFAAGLSPYVVHLAMAGPGAAIRGMIIQPVFDLRGGRHLPIPPNPHHFDGFLQGAGALDQPRWPFPAPTGPFQLDLWLGLLLAVTAVLLIAGWTARHRDRRLLAIALFCAGLLPQALQRPDSTHLAWVSCVPFGVFPAAIVQLAGTPARRVKIVAAATPAVLLLALVPFFTWRAYTEAVEKTFGHRLIEETIRHGDRVFPYRRHDAAEAVNALLPEVDKITKKGDTLFVGPGDLRKTPYSEAFLYYLLPRLEPATRFIEMDPGIANAPDSGLAGELAHADIVILSTIRDDWNEPNDSQVFGPDKPNEVLAADFCLVGKFGKSPFYNDRGLYELYRRCH